MAQTRRFSFDESDRASLRLAISKDASYTSPTNPQAEIPDFSHARSRSQASKISTQTPIHVVNEKIIHGVNVWCNSLSAFDNLTSANAEARTHAIQQHAKGDASIVHSYWSNGCGTWKTISTTDRGHITKFVFVNTITLRQLVSPPTSMCEGTRKPAKRRVLSRSPGLQNLRSIKAFRSEDSIRSSRNIAGLQDDTENQHFVYTPAGALQGSLANGNQRSCASLGWSREDMLGKDGQTVGQSVKTDAHIDGSFDDLRDFAALYPLL